MHPFNEIQCSEKKERNLFRKVGIHAAINPLWVYSEKEAFPSMQLLNKIFRYIFVFNQTGH